MITSSIARQVVAFDARAAAVAVDRSPENPGGWRGDLANGRMPASFGRWPFEDTSWCAMVVGPRGSGKTAAMARRAAWTAAEIKRRSFGEHLPDDIVRGWVRWIAAHTLADLAARWAGWDEPAVRWRRIVAELQGARVLFIDDLSMAPTFTNAADVIDGLQRIVTARYDAARPTCFSSAVPPEDPAMERAMPSVCARLQESLVRWELREPIRAQVTLEGAR